MKTSESIAQLAPALLAAQRLIGGTVKDKVGEILTKSGGSYEYNYSDLSSVLDAIKAPLNDNGLILLQSASADASGVIVNTRLLHESGEWIEEALYMPVSANTPQAFGSAITYCRRYGAQTICNLKAMDDDGAEASKPPAKVTPLPTAIPANIEGHDLFAALSADAQTVVRDDVVEMTALVKLGNLAGALEILNERYVSQEDQLILASQMPSEPRNKIKAYRKSVEAKPHLAEQA